MAGTETNEQEQSGHRPGLRERRLSRVHFEGDTDEGNSNAYTGGAQLHQDGSVQALTLSRAKRTSVQSDGSSGGRQDYFETRDRQMAGAATYGSQGEEARGRPIRPFEHHDEAGPQHSRNLGPPGRTPFEMPMPTEDLSPKSTTFGAETPMAVEREVQYPTTNMSTGHRLLPDNMPQDPRSGPFAAHVKGNYPFHNQSTLPGMAAPRLPFSNIDTDQHQRRFSAPTDRRQDQRLGTSASPRNSLNTYRNGQEALSDPYTVLPPARISKSQTNRGANYNPQYGRGSMDLYERAQASPTPAYSFYEPPTALPAPPYHTQPVMSLKPALKRTQTEEETRRTTRDAVDIVHHHTQGLRRRNVPGTQTLESMPRNAGVLSNLLQLYGDNAPAGPRRTSSSDSKWDGEGTQMSRATSVDSHFAATRAKFGRTDSAASFATTLCEGDLDPDDPRAVRMAAAEKAKDTPGLPMSRNDEFGFNDANSISSKKSLKNMLRRTKSFMVDEDAVYGDLMGRKASAPQVGDDKKRRLSITRHVADILARHKFLLKLARALMTYGSPSHRMEQQLNATAQVLEVDAQFVHLPSVVIASFGDSDTHTSETHFVKTSGGLDLGKLHHVHTIYRQVVHDEAGVAEGSAALSRLLKAPPIYKVWQRMIFAAICAGTIAPIGFGGSFVDAWVAAAFGAALSFLQNHVVGRSPAYSNIFEISVATVTSFIARGLSRTDYFCYPALATSGVVLILPGYAILCGSLELASKNIVTGSVRMVYAIIYSLFLGFGIAVGSDLYFLVDPAGRQAQRTNVPGTITLQGAFQALNGSSSLFLDGQWTFTNDTASSTHDRANDALFQGNIACARDPNWQWWRQGIPPWALFFLVPTFTLFLCLNNLQPVWSRQLPVMVVIACIGFVTNTVANNYIFDHSDIVSFIGSFVVGMLGNLYSRIFRGTGFVVMVPGVLFLVPSGIAAAGGLAMTQVKDRGDSYSNGLLIGFRMVQVAIGITVGLFFSSFIVYSFGRRKQAALFAF